MDIRRAGDRGVLVELGEVSFDELHAAAAAVRAIPGVAACVVGHSSLLVLDVEPAAIRRALDAASSVPRAASRLHRLEVSFDAEDAPDLPLLLERAGLPLDRVLDELRALRFRARYLGFLAGFAYLEGLPAAWALPRRVTSRPRIPAGSFAIGGEMAGLYPIDSPGGWNIVGRSAARLWDEDRDPPNLIAAGDEIAIETARGPFPPQTARLPSSPIPSGALVATVIRGGQRTLLVSARDVNRYAFGLPPGGPFDPEAAAAANRAVGNPESAPLLECAFVGPELLMHERRLLAWSGAGSEVPRQFAAAKGDVVRVGPLRNGARGYVAVEGGWVVAGPKYALAPMPLEPDTLLQAAEPYALRPRIATLVRGAIESIEVLMGPHAMPVEQWTAIESSEWEVTSASDRVGVRFRATRPVGIEPPRAMRSCGVQFGTVQWHADGTLVAMGPDHPVTGGYLQPMTIRTSELWKLAQLVPGAKVRWRVSR